MANMTMDMAMTMLFMICMLPMTTIIPTNTTRSIFRMLAHQRSVDALGSDSKAHVQHAVGIFKLANIVRDLVLLVRLR